jgi:hypothetical protein
MPCPLQCDRYNLNVKFLIFFNFFYNVHSVEVLSKDPCQQKEFSSLMITKMDLRFEPYVFNLISK